MGSACTIFMPPKSASEHYNIMPRALHDVSQSPGVPTFLELLFTCTSEPIKAHSPRLIAHSYSTHVAQSRAPQIHSSHVFRPQMVPKARQASSRFPLSPSLMSQGSYFSLFAVSVLSAVSVFPLLSILTSTSVFPSAAISAFISAPSAVNIFVLLS